MRKSLPRLRHPILVILGISASALFTACGSGDEGGTGPGGTDQNGSPAVTLQVRHYHYPEANENTVVVDDIPDPITIRLNGIPGQFGGTPTEDRLFDTTLARGESFTIPWARLLQAPGTQPLPYIKEPVGLDSVTPASVKIMRVGTFAEAEPDQDIYPDSASEGYGFYDMTLKTGATAMYFSGPAMIHADYPLCDGTRLVTRLDIPAAGFYFMYLKRSGGNLGFALLPNVKNLIFGVRTSSNANYQYSMEEYSRIFACLYDDELFKAGAGKAGGAVPLSFREWQALSR